ncbi:MAG: cohesin domain-containing protein [Candidatus Bathyarchaeota archaeon]|nr:cohesin domain-containing protein [Candidatus Bathyarchaeota archaeon]
MKMTITTSVTLIFAAILLTSMFWTGINYASPSGTATLHFDPPSVTVKYGETFTVCLNISDVVDLIGFDIKISYDTEILDVVESSLGVFLNEPTILLKNETDEAAGTIWIAIISMTGEGTNGNGTLATITFESIVSGECVLDLYETFLADSSGSQIDHEKVNGYVKVTGITRLYIDPPEIIVSVSEEFTVYVKLDNVRNLYGFDIRIAYDASLLDLIEVELFPENIISGGVGSVFWLAFQFPKTGHLKLVALTFRAKAEGSCPIEIYHDDLATLKYFEPARDTVGWPIPHSTEDGHCSIGPIAGTENLQDTIESWDLDNGFEKSLTAKLDDAINLLDKGNTNGAVHKLQDLIKKVTNDAKHLTQEQKDCIIQTTQEIIEHIE